VPEDHLFFAPTPKCVEDLAAAELKEMGANSIRLSPGGVYFNGTLETGYRACLWSRIASKILLNFSQFQIQSQDDLYEIIAAFPWQDHFEPSVTLAVDCHLKDSVFTHSLFAAQRVKDGIVDSFRKRTGRRPTVQLEDPDMRINIYMKNNSVTMSLDLSGSSLHRRNYRGSQSITPLKETLAAAVLFRSRWKEIAHAGGTFLDPMCGSGTLLIEAALMAGRIAPGLLREHFGFHRWKGHSTEIWTQLTLEAEDLRESGRENIPRVIGYDINPQAVKAALENIQQAGLTDRISVQKQDIRSISAGRKHQPGLIAVNPPYGLRLQPDASIITLYGDLGLVLAHQFQGWRAAILTPDVDLARSTGLRAVKSNVLFNGPIECRLYQFQMTEETEKSIVRSTTVTSVGGFENRLRKNLRHLQKWARRSGVSCFRVYDADLPDFAVAIDLYECTWAQVSEYKAPKSVDSRKALERLNMVIRVLPELLDIPVENIHLKIRRQQKGKKQYEKLRNIGSKHQVKEGGLKFYVNFTDYLDTGIYLDHRLTRNIIRTLASGKSFLNLFSYTGTATVNAAVGGAISSTSVDTSNTYLNWAADNLKLNGFNWETHNLVRADCLDWLEVNRDSFDLIFLDPPTFSVTKSQGRRFDIQTGHANLIQMALNCLNPGGILIFSTNFRKFKLDSRAFGSVFHEDITPQTIPEDFRRRPRIHQVWKFRK